MKILPVADVRAHFSSVLKEAESGKEIGISFGRKKETIAVIIPIEEYKKLRERKLGTLEGKVTVEFSDDWALSDENDIYYSQASLWEISIKYNLGKAEIEGNDT